jgi:uncharacterized protein (DUF1330 family)
MSHEILVGLNVLDDRKYSDYRKAMTPILLTYDGFFGYDFKVSEVLISEGSKDINRVFTINFRDKAQMEAFFSDPEYIAVKEQYFLGSVGDVTRISSYEKPA